MNNPNAAHDQIIRPLGARDTAAVVAFERAVFPEDAWSAALLRQELSSPWGHYLGVFEGEDLVAYGGIKGLQDADLMTLGVRGDRRRKGIASTLLAALLQVARDNEMERLFLEVRHSNLAARRLYEQHGFTVIDVIKGYYRSPIEDATVMCLVL